MKRRKLLWLKSDEGGAAELIEAAFIYPVVFLSLFVLIYIGLYIMQNMTLVSYTQKIASLAARDVACVGYINTGSGDKDGMIYNARFSTAAAEGVFKIGDEKDGATSLDGMNITFKPKDVDVRAYRYWYGPLADDSKTCCEDMLRKLGKQNAIICASDDFTVKVKCENQFITQYIDASIEQNLAGFAVLDFFGIETPTVKATAKVPVSDTDELVRNTDFVVDSLETVARKFGVDVNSVKDTIVKTKEKLGLN